MSSPSVAPPTSVITASADPATNALLGETKWGGPVGTGTTLSFSFPYSSSSTAVFVGHNGEQYSAINPEKAMTAALDAAQQAAMRTILQEWEAVADVKFVEISESAQEVGDIRVAFTSAPYKTGLFSMQAWGWGGFPSDTRPAGGDIWLSSLSRQTSKGWEPGSFNYRALAHEVGHALGLKHPFEGSVTLDAARDSLLYTLMSYTPVPHSRYFNGDYYVTVSPQSPMLLDIRALQHLYGPNRSYRAGDDLYTFDPAQPFFRTIWDAGGTDAISVENFSAASIIDLTPGAFSVIGVRSKPLPTGEAASRATYDGSPNLAIAYDVVIEDAIGGSGDDVLRGNAASNWLQGSTGDDRLEGGGGDDRLDGGAGIDTAVYVGNRSEYEVDADGVTVVLDRGARDGRDALSAIERLQFADVSVALDLQGNAGVVATFLGAVFGAAALSDLCLVGSGLQLADAGLTKEQLMSDALDARFGGSVDDATLVEVLFQNVFGHVPDGTAFAYLDALATGQETQIGLALLAAASAENALRIDLTGLADTGMAFAPLQ